ncbi:hypothetical protein [Emticicia sp. C21]|uniref:hypothetical protein n=1 Tax=Emticicia sp. C21 TaxID=2302915 RepID=UPI000E34494B|nr:hypothetical protein [Emticicia sp. C21]RFS16786.1 hypothetical protein D0T08_08890 [Emticicia sp. C21]
MKTSTKLYLSLAFYLSVTIAFAQTTKVVDTPGGTVISTIGGNEIPHSTSILDIRSTNKGVLLPRMTTANRDVISVPQAGLLIYNTSTNQFNYHNGSSWQAASFGNQWGVNGSILHHGGQVGVGTANMTNNNTFLTVRGNLGGTNLEGMYVDASSNTGKAFYGYSVNDSSRAYHYFDGYTSKWNLAIGNTDRLTITSSGLVGIGTTSPGGKLHVVGSSYFDGGTFTTGQAEVNGSLYVNNNFDVDLDGYINRDAIVGRNLDVTGTSALDGNVTMGSNATVDGTLTVNNGKGVAYNASNSSNLRIYKFTTANFHAILPAHGSAVTAIAFNGGFTSTPHVMVADIASSSGTAGELDRVILILSGCNLSGGTTSCTAKIVNTDNSALDYNITWNCIAIGY